jgi:LysM repeat protein
VREGDTLSRIASRFDRTVGQLLLANPEITDPNLLRVGQVLVIPPPDAPEGNPAFAGTTDPHDDITDQDGEPVAGQSYVDIASLGARLDGGRLRIELALLARPPQRLDPSGEALLYAVDLDADGDEEPDFEILYGNDLDGTGAFVAGFRDLGSGRIRSGASFPGSVEVRQPSITWLVERDALADSEHFLLAARVARTFYPGGRGDPETEQRLDFVPDQQWPGPNPRWVEVGG